MAAAVVVAPEEDGHPARRVVGHRVARTAQRARSPACAAPSRPRPTPRCRPGSRCYSSPQRGRSPRARRRRPSRVPSALGAQYPACAAPSRARRLRRRLPGRARPGRGCSLRGRDRRAGVISSMRMRARATVQSSGFFVIEVLLAVMRTLCCPAPPVVKLAWRGPSGTCVVHTDVPFFAASSSLKGCQPCPCAWVVWVGDHPPAGAPCRGSWRRS